MATDIRPMMPADKPSVMQILRTTPEFKPFEITVAEDLIDCYFNDPAAGYHILVAEADSGVSGYICFGDTPLTIGTWDIYWIAVSSDMREKGIGSALLEAAEGKIARAGGRMALIETSSIPSYANTRRFYDRRGYRTVARVPDFYEPGDDKLIMVKRFM